MPRETPRPALHHEDAPHTARAERGASLIELLMVLIILGLLTTMAIPRYAVAAETARFDSATSVLHSIWLAERMHWLEHRSYADDLDTLVDLKLLEGALATVSDPYSYSITSGSASAFTAQALRGGSSTWSGSLTIDESGNLTGTSSDGGGHVVSHLPD